MTPATTPAVNPTCNTIPAPLLRAFCDVHPVDTDEMSLWDHTFADWTAARKGLPSDEEWFLMTGDEHARVALGGKLSAERKIFLEVGKSEQAEYSPWDYALKPLPDQKYSGWFPRGRFAIVAGSSGAMKTTTLIQALVSARDGKSFLGHEGGGMSFCILFADRGKWDVEETLYRMGFNGQVPYRCINGLPREEALAAIKDEALKHGVLVIDGADLLVEDNNDGTSVAAFTTGLQKIAEKFGTAMIVTTGAGKMTGKMLKDGGERRSIVKGSEVWSRTGGTVFTLNSEHDGTKKTRRLIVQHRNADTENYLLELVNGLLVLVDEEAKAETEAENSFLNWVLDQDTFSWKQVHHAFPKMSGTYRGKAIDGLVQAGTVKKHVSKGRVSFEVLASRARPKPGTLTAEQIPWDDGQETEDGGAI